jgi:hypothetical protein
MNKRITQNVANYLAKPEHHAVSAFNEGTASGVQSSSFRRHSVRPNSIFQTSQAMMKSTVLSHLVQTIRLGFSYSCYFPPIRFGFGRIEGWQQVEPPPKQQCTTIESHSLRHLPLRRNWSSVVITRKEAMSLAVVYVFISFEKLRIFLCCTASYTRKTVIILPSSHPRCSGQVKRALAAFAAFLMLSSVAITN